MKTKPDFEEILGLYKDDILIKKINLEELLTKVWNKAVQQCAESAEIQEIYTSGGIVTIINKESILQNLIK